MSDAHECIAPRWSVVTVTFNSADKLRTLWNCNLPEWVEWIVVDNASTDDSREWARSAGATVIELEQNVGFAAANNVGAAAAAGTFLALVNPDVTATWSDLESTEAYLRDQRVLAAPALLNLDGTPQPNGRGAPRVRDKVLSRVAPSLARRVGYYSFAAGRDPHEVWWITGAVILCDVRIWQGLDGFDEGYFLYHEDVDLCVRAWRSGTKVVVMPRIAWTHGWERAARGLQFSAWKLELRSMLRFYKLYPGLVLRPLRKTDPSQRVVRSRTRTSTR